MHFHCYTWTGNGDDRRNESERRPQLAALFQNSPLPPMRTCDWLLKPARHIADSPRDVDSALLWLRRMYLAAEVSFLRPADEARIALDSRLEHAHEALAGGVDVQWGIWLTGGRFMTCGVICCSPNRHADHACPQGGPDDTPERRAADRLSALGQELGI